MYMEGHTFPEFTHVVDKTKAYEFARAIGDELRQIGDDVIVPFGMMLFVVVQDAAGIFEAFHLTWKQVFLGGVSLRYHRPIKAGETLRGSTTSRVFKEKGETGEAPGIIELETRYIDALGSEVLREVSTLQVSGEPAEMNVETSRWEPTVDARASDQSNPLQYECDVDRLAIAWMAVALQDPNLIHIEDRVAQEAGYPTVIAHGTFPIGAVGAMLTKWAGEDTVLDVDIKLVAPTFPGSSITVEGSIVERVGNKQTLDVLVRQKDRIVARGRAIGNAQVR